MSDPNYEPTRLIRKSSSSQGGQQPPQPASDSPSEEQPGRDPEETIYDPPTRATSGEDAENTRILRRSGGEAPPDSEQTRLVRPSSKSREGNAAPADELPEGPVVGWLVVVEGPGRGRSVTLGYGMNSIGREVGNRVCLSFGDQLISRHKHATITYDPRGKKFFIQHGESNNLTYLADEPVLAPAELTGGELIRLGDDTVIKFVPLCGEDFDWEDNG